MLPLGVVNAEQMNATLPSDSAFAFGLEMLPAKDFIKRALICLLASWRRHVGFNICSLGTIQDMLLVER
jgi:hypothetical protein